MRNVYLVAYDVSVDKRRTKLFHKLKGYGDALQYSLFRCILTPSQRVQLRASVWDIIDHSTDRILIVDLGPDDGRSRLVVETWGKQLDDPANRDGPLVF